jgi:hypothetical protein
MKLDYFTAQMENNAETIRQMVENISDEQARWKPNPDSWSILEVINHLYDEERQDFRVRLDIILHRPDQTWPGIDPAGWVAARRYNERDLGESLTNFLNERQESLAWLKGLASPDWDVVYETSWGQMTAGDMFAAWVAHDLLHLRQLVELQWAFTTLQLQPYQVDYAGQW